MDTGEFIRVLIDRRHQIGKRLADLRRDLGGNPWIGTEIKAGKPAHGNRDCHSRNVLKRLGDLFRGNRSAVVDSWMLAGWRLARNALRAMPDGGTLRVEGILHDSDYLVRFTDTGRGMADEERENLFHPYHSFFDEGSGIGMAIVYRIVEEHGGRVAVESREGEGTAITVALPVAPDSMPLFQVEA